MTASAAPDTEILANQRIDRRRPVGAELIAPGRTHFRVWAPPRQRVELVIEGGESVELAREGEGYHSGEAAVGAGALYRFRLDGEEMLYPDPASRFQPDGPHGPSEVIDPDTFAWTDADWKGVTPRGRVIYEMHIGTFTPEGTWSAAIERLPRLAELGVNVLEVMPVADFPGRFGWGYDGVDLFAPTRLYGRPNDFRAFVDRAHALGLAVILDVVYNHLGPDGDYLKAFTPAYFSAKHSTEWGEALNFDGPDSGPVREFFISNATYWIDEYHLDGLRLDATQSIFDDGPEHILVALGQAARRAAGARGILLVGENEPQNASLLRPVSEAGGGLDMLWNDDFHHSARVALTGRAEAYYSDTRGRPQELISAVKSGFLFQGQYYTWQKRARGTPALDLPPWNFVLYTDNHDQVANSFSALRVHALTSPGRWRAMTALLLLAPGTPMLFQGQEFASSSRFYYFADHKPDLAGRIEQGRLEFLRQFKSLDRADATEQIPSPHAIETFQRCKIDHSEVEKNSWAEELHRDLLRLRRDDPTFSRQEARCVDGAVLGPEAFVLRFFGHTPALDRLLLVNLGADLDRGPMPEPLLAPPAGHRWDVGWSSEDVKYNAAGTPALYLDEAWLFPGQAALVMVPVKRSEGGGTNGRGSKR
jgi:maltooligosyltrehalose trehalohydrolase